MSGYRRCCLDNAIFILVILSLTSLAVCTERKRLLPEGHSKVTFDLFVIILGSPVLRSYQRVYILFIDNIEKKEIGDCLARTAGRSHGGIPRAIELVFCKGVHRQGHSKVTGVTSSSQGYATCFAQYFFCRSFQGYRGHGLRSNVSPEDQSKVTEVVDSGQMFRLKVVPRSQRSRTWVTRLAMMEAIGQETCC